ncbi:MAG: TIM barrel protein [Anaerolineae bacterium]|nr:TIM barrel protein [Anaerolineae bacterium]
MIHVGNAPCSWGSLEFDGLAGEKLTFDRVLDELAATGYVGTELGDWGFMPTEPAFLQAELRKRLLVMTGAFVPVAFKDAAAHADGEARAVQVAKLLAAVAAPDTLPFLVLADENGSVPERTQNAGRIGPSLGLSEAQWQIYAAGVNRVAQAVRRETGLRCVFHHHCAGYVETPDEIAALLAHTDPSSVGLVFDTGHYIFGAGVANSVNVNAQTVLDGLARFAERIWYVHFKDCAASVAHQAAQHNWDYFEAIKQGVFCELGQGCVPFAEVLAWLKARAYAGFITVEQDVLPGMGAPKESATRNRSYLRSLGL